MKDVRLMPLWENHGLDLPPEWEVRKDAEHVAIVDPVTEKVVGLTLAGAKHQRFNKMNVKAARNNLAHSIFAEEYGADAFAKLSRAAYDAAKDGVHLSAEHSAQLARIQYLAGD
jgi:hypothetical protein